MTNYDPTDVEIRLWVDALARAARDGTFPIDVRVWLDWTPEDVERYGRNADLPQEPDLFA